MVRVIGTMVQANPILKKLKQKTLEEAEFIYLKGFYFEKYFMEEDENATLEDLKEAAPDTFCYAIRNIKEL